MNVISKAVEVVGSQRALAEACGVSQPAVARWVRVGSAPAEYCAAIETACAGQVTRQQIHPDDWVRIWPELAEQAASQEVSHAAS